MMGRASILLLLALAGCGESVSEKHSNERRDADIRYQERTQDSLEDRVGRLEAEVATLKAGMAK